MHGKFCVIDDRGNHFSVEVSARPPLWAKLAGAGSHKGVDSSGKIWIRAGLSDEETDAILRHEIAHPRVPRIRGEFNPLRNQVLRIMVLLVFIGGPVYYLLFHGLLLEGIAVVALVLWTLYLILRTVDSKEHERRVEEVAKSVTYRLDSKKGLE